MSTHDASTPGDSISTASPAGSTLAMSMSATSSTQGDAKISCRWKECSEVFDDPEDLYVHLCNAHVGRKSTNNLCLTCGWEGCNVTCAKRDHITSHLRVHTPLKPHACETCNKLFKRPQDLKKHERIHTEQHQQVRQAKFQSKSDLANAPHTYDRYSQNAADNDWSRSHMHGHPHMAPYHAPLYPNLPGSHQTLQQPSYSFHYGMARRDLTPVSLVESASASSLSPLSSHIATPAGSSPAAMHHYSHGMPQSLDRGYLNMHNDQSRGQCDYDPNSYSYLAQGSNVAGTKRGHDAVATAAFFDDIKRKKVAPTYDSAMATRIEDTFANGIDDASLQALLDSFSDSYETSSTTSSTGHDHQQQQQPQARGMSLPEAFKQTDLADLNAFLLEVGANAAREADNSASASLATTPFDFVGAINSYGLNSVPGFDESIFQFQAQDQLTPSHPSDHQWSASNAYQRPIAQLPHRSASVGYPSLPSSFAPTYPSMRAYTNQPINTSFDSIRTSRGPSYVPQLAPKEMNGPVYRHVEALTRAEPLQRPIDSSLRSTNMEPRMKGEDGDREDAMSTPDAQSPRSSSPASPSPSRSHVDKSPKITYPRLGVRREDSMDGIEEDVAAMDVNQKQPIPSTIRRNHAMIILDLLRAINFPQRPELKLAPILAKIDNDNDNDDEEMVHTPTKQASEGSNESKQSTPKIVNARNLPNIASLLN